MLISDDEEVESPLPAADQAQPKQEGGKNNDDEEDTKDARAMDAA